MNAIRWILLLPASIALSYLAEVIISKIRGIGTMIFPEIVSQTINASVAAFLSGFVLIIAAFAIAPSRKHLVIKVFTICGVIYAIAQAVFLCHLASQGVVGSYWFPIVLALAFIAGLISSFSISSNREEERNEMGS